MKWYWSVIFLVLLISLPYLIPIILDAAEQTSAPLSRNGLSMTGSFLLQISQEPDDSPLRAVFSRYATWLALVACSSTLALIGSAAIVARIRRISGGDDER
ncbi:hypothetical protein [Chloroflexus sp. Y-396-1]|uniref:hypothetical protein n=1 Tax=Chloroflexus sp. Y-396-1 TaxID=867845 RepID=UPI0012EB2AC4|nr:hypothetical protein [Chloroflexus sp. Y-396-1]